MHRMQRSRHAVIALLCAWTIAYFYSYGHRLADEFLLTIQMIPGAIFWGWLVLPPNMFRVITGAEPSTGVGWTIIIGYWFIMFPLQIAYLKTRLNMLLVVIMLVLLVSTHGCYQWANYDAW
jgi:hypothetical protein